jgi:hypothetical protein
LQASGVGSLPSLSIFRRLQWPAVKQYLLLCLVPNCWVS